MNSNASFHDFIGGVQLLHGEADGTRTAMPVLLIGVCVSGAVGNLLVFLIFVRDFRSGRGSEAKALLASLACTDLLLLLVCAPVRALTYYKQTWTAGSFVCSTTDWFQHACVVAKTLILAATTRAKHTAHGGPVPVPAMGPLRSPTWIHGALALIWIVALMFPVPQMLFASVEPHGSDALCVYKMPPCASDFMSLFYKIYPTATFVAPVTFTLAFYTKSLHAAVNHHAPSPRHESKVTLVLLCLSGALGLMLLPEWGTFTWVKLGYTRPPVGLLLFAQVLLYTCSAVSPVILMTMYDDVRQGLVTIWYRITCRSRASKGQEAQSNKCPETGNGAELQGANSTEAGPGSEVGAGNAVPAPGPDDKTFPDVEHFWTGRRNTQVEQEQDPIPWEREEKML